jgi:hypothetical protein
MKAAALALGALLVWCPAPAWAHAMLVEAQVLPFWQIRVDSWYESGEAPGGAKVEVRRGDGGLIASGRLTAEGVFAFECRETGPLTIIVNDGLGHRAETVIPAERLAKQAAEVLSLCLVPPPSLLPGPLLAPPPLASLPTVEVWSYRTGPRLDRLLLGVGFLLAVACAWWLWMKYRRSAS